jgi:hypothetical protein
MAVVLLDGRHGGKLSCTGTIVAIPSLLICDLDCSCAHLHVTLHARNIRVRYPYAKS